MACVTAGPSGAVAPSDSVSRRLLDDFQRNFPLTARPFAEIGEALGITEGEVLESLRTLREKGVVARVGGVVAARRISASTLAAMAVPAERLEEVARIVSAHPEVNHNYEREHRLNLWFVVVAAAAADVRRVLDEIAAATGLDVVDLPLVEPFHIDLGFPLSWT